MIDKTILIEEERFKYPSIYNRKQKLKERFNSCAPNRKLNDYGTLKWLHSKVSPNVNYRSIMNLLPNEGISEGTHEEELKERIRRKIEKDKHSDKFLEINTKYLYSLFMNDKIDKLKSLFLEFDEDGSRKLELNELEKMFNMNSIHVTNKDLFKLFFNDKKSFEINETNAYLDFYQFIEFALSETKDQEFRDFMRSLKDRFEHNRKLKASSTNITKRGNSENVITNKSQNVMPDDEVDFLPMNFNLLLDYFNKRGKLRGYWSSIQDCISKLNRYINLNEYHNRLADSLHQAPNNKTHSKSISGFTDSFVGSNNDNKSASNNILYEDINIEETLSHFSKLINQQIPKENKQDINYLLSLQKGKPKISGLALNFDNKVSHSKHSEGHESIDSNIGIENINSKKFCSRLLAANKSSENDYKKYATNYYESFKASLFNKDHEKVMGGANINLSTKEKYFKAIERPRNKFKMASEYLESSKSQSPRKLLMTQSTESNAYLSETATKKSKQNSINKSILKYNLTYFPILSSSTLNCKLKTSTSSHIEEARMTNLKNSGTVSSSVFKLK